MRAGVEAQAAAKECTGSHEENSKFEIRSSNDENKIAASTLRIPYGISPSWPFLNPIGVACSYLETNRILLSICFLAARHKRDLLESFAPAAPQAVIPPQKRAAE
jgi:hypothetical protein